MLEFIKRLLGITTKSVETVEKTAPYKVEAPVPTPVVAAPVEAQVSPQVDKKTSTGTVDPIAKKDTEVGTKPAAKRRKKPAVT